MDETPTERPDFQVEYYFFYGTLMDRVVLARILQQPHRPEIYSASIKGWQCKMWGDYPALVLGSDYVRGMAYEVRSRRERDCLTSYETDAYKLRNCLIEFERGSVHGKTLVWNGDTGILRQGTFDLKDSLLRQKEFSIYM